MGRQPSNSIILGMQNGWMPLNTAASNGHADVVKLPPEKGANVTIKSTNRWTPLNSASSNGHFEVVKKFGIRWHSPKAEAVRVLALLRCGYTAEDEVDKQVIKDAMGFDILLQTASYGDPIALMGMLMN